MLVHVFVHVFVHLFVDVFMDVCACVCVCVCDMCFMSLCACVVNTRACLSLSLAQQVSLSPFRDARVRRVGVVCIFMRWREGSAGWGVIL